MKSSKLKRFYGLLTTFDARPPWEAGQTTLQLVFPLLFLLLFAAAFAYAMPQLSTIQTLAFAGGIILVCICMMSTEAALYILIFSMLLSPEIIIGKTGGTSLGRGITLRIDDFVILLIGVSWLAKMSVNKDLGFFLKTPLNKPIAYYLTACLVSTLLGAVFANVELKTGIFYVLKYFEYVFIYFMVANHLESKKQARNYVWAIFVTAVIVSVMGIAQIPEGERVSAPFEGETGEPNTFGGYLLLIICLATGFFATIRSYPNKLFYGGLIVLLAIPFFYTGSRSSYLGMIPAMLSFVWLAEEKRWAFVMASLLVVGLVLPFTAPEPARDRIAYTFEQGKGREDVVELAGVKLDTSTSERIRSWGTTSKEWAKHPVFGYGITGYKFVDAQYFRVLIETGLVGLLLFLHLQYSILAEAYRNFRKTSEAFDEALTTGFIAGFIGLLFHAIGANTFIIVRIMEPFWFILAVIVRLPSLKFREGQTPAHQ
jgi:O-antigen ligase